MEIRDQIIQEYLASGCGYRQLQKKYGISRTTICKWVQVYQGIHNEEQATEVLKPDDNLEQDEDVQKVYHNLK